MKSRRKGVRKNHRSHAYLVNIADSRFAYEFHVVGSVVTMTAHRGDVVVESRNWNTASPPLAKAHLERLVEQLIKQGHRDDTKSRMKKMRAPQSKASASKVAADAPAS
jgi:hypothetical protein